MSTEWILDTFKQQHLTRKDEFISEKYNPYPQDNKLFVCDCSCKTVWQHAWYGEIDSYKDFPTIGKQRKRIPGHENRNTDL